MLYARWREIVQDLRSETALLDAASGERWTFGELADLGEKYVNASERIASPQGHGPQFILSVIRAWKDNAVVLPLDGGQTRPEIEGLFPECAHLKLTSGSTGAPRVVAFTGDQLAADAGNIVKTMKLRRDWPNIGVISLAHSYGFSNLVLPLLLHGIPLVLVPAPLPEIMRRAMAGYEAVSIPAVPALWRVWHETRILSNKVKLAISAGAPLPIGLERSIYEDSGIKIHNFYGSSECGGIAYDDSSSPRNDGTYVGKAMSGVDLSVGEDGCLIVRSGAVGETYLPKSSPSLGNCVFLTSDLTELKGTCVFLHGRLGDQINVAGRKVSPETIERSLMKHPSVRDCLVFGVPADGGERSELIAACISLHDHTSADELKKFLLATLPAWQVPREWWFLDTLQTNERGKLPRAEWRKRFMEARRSKGDGAPN